MSSTGLAESSHDDDARASMHAAVSVVSPGKEDEEEKNQDRLMLLDAADGSDTCCRFAIVCDGTSTSPYSAPAAEYVAGQVRELFREGGLGRAAAALREMRAALLGRPLKLDEGQSDMLRSMYEEIVRQKYQNAYQTTFVAVCLKRSEGGTVLVKAVACGDSALFIFREDGELLYNNVNLEGALDPFKHASPLTPVLPDSYAAEAEHVLFDFTEYSADAHLLLCSDGLYDGFANFKEIYSWLSEHRAELRSAARRERCLSELHDRLDRKKGDDDISFIWLYPAAPPASKKESETGREEDDEEAPRAANAEGRRGFFARLRAGLSRWLRRATGYSSRPRRGLPPRGT